MTRWLSWNCGTFSQQWQPGLMAGQESGGSGHSWAWLSPPPDIPAVEVTAGDRAGHLINTEDWSQLWQLAPHLTSHREGRRINTDNTVELIQLFWAWKCHNLVRQRPHYHWLLWRQIIFMRNSHFQKCSEWWRAGERSEGGVCSTMRFYKLSLLKLLLSSLLIWAVVHLLLYESQTVVTFQY